MIVMSRWQSGHSFKEALEEARLAHYAEIGSNPRLTKEAVVGQLYVLASRLASDREDYKASDALLKLAKVQGWMGAEPDSLWTTFSKLSQAELDEVRRRLREQQAAQATAPVEQDPQGSLN